MLDKIFGTKTISAHMSEFEKINKTYLRRRESIPKFRDETESKENKIFYSEYILSSV